MWIRIARAYRLYWVAEPLTLIRRHENSMSRQTDRMRANTGRVLQEAWDRAYVPKSRLLFWAKVFSFHRFQCAWMYHEEGRTCKAVATMAESVFFFPFFLELRDVNEPVGFRVRAALQFLWHTGAARNV